MCLNRRFIKNSYTGQSVLVDCGVCPACQQKRRNYQKLLFTNNSDGYVLFVTLTYDDEHLTYFYFDDLECEDVPIYRNNKKIGSFINDYFNEYAFGYYDDLHRLYLIDGCRVGVLWQKDFSNFFKRLRRFFERRGISLCQYFYVREYGSVYSRPHLHIAFYIEMDDVQSYVSACVACWKMCIWSKLDLQQSFKFVPCKSTSSYITGYLNKSFDLPYLLRSSQICPKTWHSHFFGFQNIAFRFENFWLNAIKYQPFYYSEISKVSTNVAACIYPKYVVTRYFPRVKGFSRLSFRQFVRIYTYGFAKSDCLYLEYSDDDVKTNLVLIRRCKTLASLYGIDYDYFLFVFFKFYIAYASYLIKSTHFDSDGMPLPVDHLRDCYLNLGQYFHGQTNKLKYFGFNPNFTTQNIEQHFKLTAQYYQTLDTYRYKKQLKKHYHG